MKERIEDILLRIGFAPHTIGFQYLREATEIVLDDEDSIHAITKNIYGGIADRHLTRRSAVERAIRTSIERALTDRGDLISEVLLLQPNLNSGSYTNGEMIALIAKAVKREERNESK